MQKQNIKYLVMDVDGTLTDGKIYMGSNGELCKAFNAHFNNAKSIWVWTGYLYENIVNKDIYNHVDVIVDGQYQDELHDFRLKWRGSSNQRVIDVKETLKNDKIVLCCD